MRSASGSRYSPFDRLDEPPNVMRQIVEELLGEDSVAVGESFARSRYTSQEIAEGGLSPL